MCVRFWWKFDNFKKSRLIRNSNEKKTYAKFRLAITKRTVFNGRISIFLSNDSKYTLNTQKKRIALCDLCEIWRQSINQSSAFRCCCFSSTFCCCLKLYTQLSLKLAMTELIFLSLFLLCFVLLSQDSNNNHNHKIKSISLYFHFRYAIRFGMKNNMENKKRANI